MMLKARINCKAFTLIEIIITLILVGLFAIFGIRILTTAVRGYVLAQNADEIVQKAQIALQRMTIEFSYIQVATTSGNSTSLTYNAGNSIGNHAITLNGSNILYLQGSNNYVLTDGVAAGGLVFSYYNTYDTAGSSTFSANTNIIGISITMKGDDSATNLTKTFSTRVAIKTF